MKWAISAVLAFSVCRPPPPTATLEAVESQVNELVKAVDPKRGRAIPTGEWAHRSGLTLMVPEGWETWEGLPGDIRLLQMSHEASQVEVNLYRIINLNPGEPPIRRPGCEWIFKDTGRHTLVPALRPAATSTCIGSAGDPMVVQVWVGAKLDADFALEVVYPSGQTIAGQQIAEPVLRSLRWR